MGRRIRVGVVGVGYFGRFHAAHYARHPRADLVAIADVARTAAEAVAQQHGCAAVTDYRDLVGLVDAVSVAVPTPEHFAVANELMAAGIDVLVEKPMTHDLASAEALAAASERHQRILQVGHIERFSACFRALRGLVKQPLYIECYRISPWRERGAEVDVVFDLMIHDIDLILGLAGSPLSSVDAVGTSVFSTRVDLANARIAFESGCVATVTASRVSHKTERSLRIFQPSGYLVCDFAASRIISFTAGAVAGDATAAIATTALDVPVEDNLANEIDEFLTSVATRRRPTVDGRVGQEAIEVASRINQSIARHHKRVKRHDREP